jgi:hypothetical protein
MESFVCLYRCGILCLDKMDAENQDERHRKQFLEIRIFLHEEVLVIPHHKCYRVRELRRVTSAEHVICTEELKHVQLHFS